MYNFGMHSAYSPVRSVLNHNGRGGNAARKLVDTAVDR